MLGGKLVERQLPQDIGPHDDRNKLARFDGVKNGVGENGAVGRELVEHVRRPQPHLVHLGSAKPDEGQAG